MDDNIKYKIKTVIGVILVCAALYVLIILVPPSQHSDPCVSIDVEEQQETWKGWTYHNGRYSHPQYGWVEFHDEVKE